MEIPCSGRLSDERERRFVDKNVVGRKSMIEVEGINNRGLSIVVRPDWQRGGYAAHFASERYGFGEICHSGLLDREAT